MKSKKKKLLFGLMIVAAIYLGFLMCVEPIITRLYFPAKEHTGIELYTEGTYLKFEDGEKFQKMIADVDFIDECEVVSFSYYDNYIRDNILYGKVSDFYILELDGGENYETIKYQATQLLTSEGTEGNFELYLKTAEKISSNLNDCFIYAFCDTSSTIRCILITGIIDSSMGNISGVLAVHCGANW